MRTPLRERLYRLGTFIAQRYCDHPEAEMQLLRMKAEKPLPLSHFDKTFNFIEVQRRAEGKPILYAQVCEALCGKCGKVVRAARITKPTKTCQQIAADERKRTP